MRIKPGVVIIEGHVQGLSNARALGEIGIPIYVVDTQDCVARHSKYCKDFFICPEYDSSELSDFLIALAKQEEIQGWLLLPSNDHAVINISKNKEKLERYYKVITPEIGIIDRICNKEVLLKLALENQISIPDSKFHNDLNINRWGLKFPVITKGKKGLSFYKKIGSKALLSNNKKELIDNLELLKKFDLLHDTFTQSIILDDGKNKTQSFAAFCVDGNIKTWWVGEKIREHPIKFGTATFSRSIHNETLQKLSTPLIKALRYTGVCEIEYLKDPVDNEYKLIEINPRTWLWVGLAIECGVNFPVYIYKYVHNITIQYPKIYKTDVYWRNFWTDLIFSLKYMFKGQFSYFDYKNSLEKELIYAVKSKSDPTPFKKMLKLLFLRWKRN